MNKREQDELWEKELRTLGYSIKALERLCAVGTDGGKLLHSIKFKLDADEGTSVLAILSAQAGEQEYVAFVGGLTLSTVMQAIRKKIRGPGLKWRESKPWRE